MPKKKAPTVENAGSSGVSNGVSVAPAVAPTKDRHWIWKWLVPPGVVVTVAGGGLYHVSREYGYMMGRLESDNVLKATKAESESKMKLVKPLLSDLAGALDVDASRVVSDDLVSSLTALKDATRIARAPIDRCAKVGHSTIAQVADEWATQKCGPTTLIPDRVTSTWPIDSENGRLKPKIFWEANNRRYDLALKRRVQSDSFAGGCWVFSRHVNLSLAKNLDIVLQTDEEGAYQFKFELQDAIKGQANVEQFLSTSDEPVTVSVDLSKISADILGDLARFCIAIAGTAPLAPERAKLHVVSAKSR